MNILDIKEEIKEARRLRDNTSAKINDYKKKGKDTTDLEKQLQGLRARVAELTAMEKLAKQTQAVQIERARHTVQGAKYPIQMAQIPESALISKGEQEQLRKQAKKEVKRAKQEVKQEVKQAKQEAKRAKQEAKQAKKEVKQAKKEVKQAKQEAKQAKQEVKQVKQEVKSWTKAQLESCERTMNKILDDNDWHEGYQFRSSEWMFIKHIRTIVLPDSVELEYIIQYKTRNHRVEKTVTKYFNPQTIQSLNKYIEQVELWVMLNSGDMDNKDIPFGARFNQVQFEQQGYPEKGWIMYK